MNITGQLLISVATLFILMIPGIILKKCRLVPDGFGKGLSNLVLYIAQPVLILYSYLDYGGGDIWLNALLVFIISIAIHIIFALHAMLLFKKSPDGRRRMLRFATIFSNAAFMGMPLINEILGAEATIYASIYNITFNLFLWSLGVHICTSNRDEDGDGVADGDVLAHYRQGEVSVKKILLHPVNIAAALGIILLATGANAYVPEIIMDSCDKLRALVAPLSMIVIGLRIADMDFHGIFSDLEMYKFLMLRHINLPLVTLALLVILNFLGAGLSYEVTTTIIILAATPAATSATMFAEKYDCDAMYVSRIVAVSTILSIVSMPLTMMLANVLL